VYHAYDIGLYEQIYNIINIRSINENSFNYFHYSLNFELCEDIFVQKEVNILFNSFLNAFLRKFHSNFPLIRKTGNKKIITKDTGWVTPYIKHLCSLKRDFYLLTSSYNDIKIMNHYKFNSKTLSHNVRETKRSYYSTKLLCMRIKLKQGTMKNV